MHSGEQQPENWGHALAPLAIGLAAVWPDILERVPAEDRQLAERALTLPLVSACDEDLSAAITQIPEALDFVIADGVVLKKTTLTGRSALELLGPGDVLARPLTATHQLKSRAASRYLAYGQVTLAAIGAPFRRAAHRWPGIADFLHECLAEQTHRASVHVAMLHQPRVEARVIALFADLAERFGHVTSDGIRIDLPLTHEIIGGLVGSRRPTVTLALQTLASEGLLKRLADNGWKLARATTSVLDVTADQSLERELDQQIEVELSQDSQGVARPFRSDLPVLEPGDQRMKVS